MVGSKVKVGVGLWRVDFEALKRVSLECERLGYYAVFYGEGLGPECFTALAALAMATERVRLGPGITFLTYRHPSLLAKIVSTLDVVSQGRLELRVGAGGAPGYGLPLPSPGLRVKQLEEALEMMKRMWAEGRVSFEGRHFSLRDAVCDPLPIQKPHPPITIAGKKERMMGLAAKHADVWEGYFPPQEYEERAKVLKRECLKVGRDPKTINRSLMLRVFIAKGEQEAREMVRRYVSERGITGERLRVLKERDLIGDPEQCLEKGLEYLRVGVKRFTLLFADAERLEPLRLYAESVMPELRIST